MRGYNDTSTRQQLPHIFVGTGGGAGGGAGRCEGSPPCAPDCSSVPALDTRQLCWQETTIFWSLLQHYSRSYTPPGLAWPLKFYGIETIQCHFQMICESTSFSKQSKYLHKSRYYLHSVSQCKCYPSVFGVEMIKAKYVPGSYWQSNNTDTSFPAPEWHGPEKPETEGRLTGWWEEGDRMIHLHS